MNIPSLIDEIRLPREQQYHVTVVSLLIKRAAVILAKQHGQIQCTMDCYFSGKSGKCHFTCCLFSSVIIQFCVTQNFDADVVVFAKHFKYIKWCEGTNGS
jgi:hypothetical protein